MAMSYRDPLSSNGYLQGKILTGDRHDIIDALATIATPSLEQVAKDEVHRLRSAFRPLTADGRGVDVVAAFAEEIGVDAETLATFMPKHSVFRNHTYLSDPYLVRDLFHDNKSLTDDGARLTDGGKNASKLFFQPTTTWSKAGDGVFRFAIMHTPLNSDPASVSARQARRLRVPVVMMDGKKMDAILQHEGRNGPILKQMHDMMATVCHDYVHTTFLYYVKGHAPDGVQPWDDSLQEGKPIWRKSPIFNYNYEVLASVGHRQIMKRVYDKHPEVKAGVIKRVKQFAESVDELCDSMRLGGQNAEAQDMERYLMTNYMRFAYHILNPDEPDLAWVKKRYSYIETDLNLHNGKGLVAIIHAHEGIPGKATGDRDIPFSEWLNSYVTAHLPVLERQTHYMNRIEKKLADQGRPVSREY